MNINIDEIRAEIESGALEPIEREQASGATAYRIWQIVTEVFRELNIQRPTPITSQYVYNICKSREPKGSKMDGRRYSEDEAKVLVRMFVQRNLQYRVEK